MHLIQLFFFTSHRVDHGNFFFYFGEANRELESLRKSTMAADREKNRERERKERKVSGKRERECGIGGWG